MRVLVTGGTGIVGRAATTALLQRGHVVHLLSRSAERDAAQWSHGVHAIAGDVTRPETIRGAADGCDAVLHLTAVVDEHGTQTFERVNVEGTRHLVREAERAGARKFVFVSSLGAERGSSPYHRSKRQGEAIVREFSGAWVVVRPGSVYGPGDEQMALLLRMIRTYPVLPVLGGGDQRFQPIWHENLGEALALAVERDDIARVELDVAGPDVTSQGDLVQRLSRITGRDVPRVDIPAGLAGLGIRLAGALGVDVPFADSQLTMLLEGNEIPAGRENALARLGVEPTPLDHGLRRLADAPDEQLPDDGVGPLRRHRYWADIAGAAFTPEGLMRHVRAHFGELIASFVGTLPEPQGGARLEEDATVTLSLPLRGHIQVRVAELNERSTTLLTLAGHPLSGAVRFLSEARGDDLRFEVQVYDRAAGVVDFVLMRAIGRRLQDAAWRDMVENVVRASGGAAAAGVRQEVATLDQDQADRIEDWARDLVMARRRDEAGV